MGHAKMPQDQTAGDTGIDAVLQYWQRLRRGRIVPARADLDPSVLGPWLNMAAIVEYAAGERIRFRLGGQGLSALLGVEARGMPLRALFAVGARARLQDLAAPVFEAPAMLTMTLIAAPRVAEAPPVHVPMAVLPLADGTGAVARALVCLEPRAALQAERPVRFHIRQARLTPLVGREVDPPTLRVIPGGRS